jgi:uncharacterized membrane protein
MSQRKRQIKATKQYNSQSLEHTEVFDDNLLPDAFEIEKLHAIDPDILSWLKNRAEKEQDFRHGAYTNRLGKIENQNKREHNTARYALSIYFILVALCVGASYLLLRDGHNLQGSIFGGAAAILALAVLVSRATTKKKEQ